MLRAVRALRQSARHAAAAGAGGRATTSRRALSSATASAGGDSSEKKRLGQVLGYGLAAFTFGLGVWQVRRRRWKIDLIQTRTKALAQAAVPLDNFIRDGVSDVKALDLRPVSVAGTLDYTKQIVYGPRSAPHSHAELRRSTPGANTGPLGTGFFVLTPLRMSDGHTVLLNRGWVERSAYAAEYERATGTKLAHNAGATKEGTVPVTAAAAAATNADAPAGAAPFGIPSPELLPEHMAPRTGDRAVFVGVARTSGEARPQYLAAQYDAATDVTQPMLYLDLAAAYRRAGAHPSPAVLGGHPLVLDVLEPLSDPKGGPLVPPVRRSRADYTYWYTTPELHSIYAITWFTLSACLASLTFFRFRAAAGRRGGFSAGAKHSAKRAAGALFGLATPAAGAVSSDHS